MKLLNATVLGALRRFSMHPSFRYSKYFKYLGDGFSYAPKEGMLETAMSFADNSDLEGSYLEFGVFRGRSFISAFHLAQMRNLSSMDFYAFDSFEGIPEISGVDAEGYQQFREEQCYCDLETFVDNITSEGVDIDKVEIVQGWFDDVLNEDTKDELPLKKASVVLIDCDLYESTVPVLNFLTDYIQDGTILIFDDWFCFRADPERGQQRAFREWLEENPLIKPVEFRDYGWNGRSFILSK